jgi:DHA1 family bicyclomycin/chloramphenicol resistance-like MFS transporter
VTQLPAARFLDRDTPPHILTLTMMAGLASLSMNIFLPSLPGMATWFAVPYATMQLSVALYLALSAVLQVLIGPLSDRFGRRRVMLVALSLFLLATVGTLLAPTAGVFLVCRMAQAVVAAGAVMSRAVVRDMVEDARAASMLGYVTMGMSLVPMIGPALGGVLDQAYGWHANFACLLVLGLIVGGLVYFDQGETAETRDVSLAAQFGLYPVLLRSKVFWGYCLSATFASGCYYAFLGGAPYVGKAVFGLTSSQTGLFFVLLAVGYTGGNFIAGRYSARFGLARMVIAGTGLTTLGLAVLAAATLALVSGVWIFFGLLTAVGIGNGLCMPNANAGMLSVRPEIAGTAAGLGSAIAIGGGAGLAALAGAVLQPGASEMPLVLLMLASSVLSNLTVLFVTRKP